MADISNGQGHAVDVRNVSKAFGVAQARTQALKGVNFQASPGELIMVVGPSGCGKTTLLSAIAGTLDFDEGEITVFKSPLHRLKSSEITAFRSRTIGFIFQQFHLIPRLTCVENVSVPLLIRGINRHQAENKADEMLSEVGLKGRGGSYPRELSGGQQQRVAIARALVHQPSLLICDEPTSALDKDTGARIMEILTSVARSADRCVIVVTHDPRILHYADQIAEMEDGRVERVYRPEQEQNFSGEH